MAREDESRALRDDLDESAVAEAYNIFLQSISLAEIQIVAVSGERRAGGIAPVTEFEVSVGYQIENNLLHFRLDGVGRLKGEEGDDTDYGEVSAGVMLSFALPDGYELSDDEKKNIERFGSTSVSAMAHPYLRESLSNTATRLNFPGVTLPMVIQTPLGLVEHRPE